MLSVNRTNGPFWIEDTEGPMSGLLCRRHGWMEGEAEYQGQSAWGMVYFFKFKDEAAEQLYKENMCWKKRTRDGSRYYAINRLLCSYVKIRLQKMRENGKTPREKEREKVCDLSPLLARAARAGARVRQEPQARQVVTGRFSQAHY